MRFNKKGQAAMEFLMTYGWAILIAIIAIAALIAFGVLNPGKSSQNTCGTANAIIPNLGCTEMKVTTLGGALTLILTNGLGADISGATMGVTPGCTMVENTQIITDGATGNYTATGCTCANGRYKGTISYTYKLGSETLSHTISAPLNVRCE